MLQKRKIGKTDMEVAPLMFGGNVFGWTADEAMSFRLLDIFSEAGFNFIDTADVYSRWVPGHAGGESETILGKWMKARGNRSRIVLATKVAMDLGDGKKGLSAAYIRRAVEDSLRRLQTDYIDLYQSHQDDPEVPIEETLAAYGELVGAGKVRAIGASNFSAARLEESLRASARNGFPAYQSLQPLYNLYDREEFEKNLEPVCRENGLSVINFYSLAAGFLTGKYRKEEDLGGKARAPRVKKYMTERGNRILAALDAVAESLHTKPACVAIAWLLTRPAITAPIASATNPEQLSDLIEATRLKLDRSHLAALEAASAH